MSFILRRDPSMEANGVVDQKILVCVCESVCA